MYTDVPHFKIAITFSGRYRAKYVEPICNELLNLGYTKDDIFYDSWHEVIINGPHGDDKLRKIYSQNSDCVVVLLSPDYKEKNWTGNVEWPAVKELINTNKAERICLLGVDSVDIGSIDGLYNNQTIAKFIDDISPMEIADFINKKYSSLTPEYKSTHKSIQIEYHVYNDKIVFFKTVESVINVAKDNEHNRITWFPDEDIKLSTPTEGAYIQKKDLPDSDYNYEVVFNHIFKPGDIMKYTIKAELTNIHHHFKNFFSNEIIVPTEKLDIILSIHEDVPDIVKTQKIYESLMNEKTEDPKETKFANPYKWTITNPELHFEYKLFW